MKNERKSVEKNNTKILALALALVLLIGGTYAWLTLTLTGTKTTKLEAGTLSLNLTDEANAINLENAVPITDEDGLKLEPYTFIVENNGTITSEYSVYLDSTAIDEGLTAMPQNRIKYSITKTVKTKVGATRDSATDTIKSAATTTTAILNPFDADGITQTNPNRLLDEGTLDANDYIEYTLRLWISQDATTAEMNNTAFSGKLRIEATQQGIEETTENDASGS